MINISSRLSSQGSFLADNQSKEKRSKLHATSVTRWLRKRYQNTANVNYLLRPHELQQHIEVQDIFENFDSDNSGKLALGEFYNLLRHANIMLKKEDVKEFYRLVDDNKDAALDFHEFKNCTLSDEANLCFAKLVEKAIQQKEDRSQSSKEQKTKEQRLESMNNDKKNDEHKQPFLPRTFGNLLNYLAYQSKKKSIKEFVENKNNNLADKLQKFSELLDLKMDKDIYFERLSAKVEARVLRTTKTRSLEPKSPLTIRKLGTSQAEFPQFNVLEDYGPTQRVNTDAAIDEEDVQFLDELDQIAANARKCAKEEFLGTKRRETKTISGIIDPYYLNMNSRASTKGGSRVSNKKSSDGKRSTRGTESFSPSTAQKIPTLPDYNTQEDDNEDEDIDVVGSILNGKSRKRNLNVNLKNSATKLSAWKKNHQIKLTEDAETSAKYLLPPLGNDSKGPTQLDKNSLSHSRLSNAGVPSPQNSTSLRMSTHGSLYSSNFNISPKIMTPSPKLMNQTKFKFDSNQASILGLVNPSSSQLYKSVGPKDILYEGTSQVAGSKSSDEFLLTSIPDNKAFITCNSSEKQKTPFMKPHVVPNNEVKSPALNNFCLSPSINSRRASKRSSTVHPNKKFTPVQNAEPQKNPNEKICVGNNQIFTIENFWRSKKRLQGNLPESLRTPTTISKRGRKVPKLKRITSPDQERK